MKNGKICKSSYCFSVKKESKELDQTELISLLVEACKLNKEVKELLSIKFNRKEMTEELFTSSRNQIIDEFFPDRGMPKMRLSHAKKAITSYKKLTGDTEGIGWGFHEELEDWYELYMADMEEGFSFAQ